MPSCVFIFRVLCAALAALALNAPSAAFAAPVAAAKQKAADEHALGQQAALRKDFRQAFDHALGAWQIDSDTPAYLFDAALWAADAGLFDKSEALFKQWLSLGNRDVSKDAKAREMLGAFDRHRAAELARQAAQASRAGDHVEARRLYLAAAQRDPADPEHLFGAAVEAEAVGDHVARRQLLTDYLKAAAPDAPNRAEAERMLGSKDTGPVAKPKDDAVPAEPAGGVSRIGLGLAIGGGALALAGIGYGVGWSMAEADYAEATRTGKDGSVSDPLKATADSRFTIGATLLGVGLAAGGVGGWLVWKSAKAAGPQVSIFSTPQQLMLTGRF